MASEAQVLAVPPGYPDHLPKPVLRDGGLYLDPYPAMPKALSRDIPVSDIAWIMVALQPWILKYSPTPYDVNWYIDGWGSGKMHIIAALNGLYGGALPINPFPAPQPNFLIPPKTPSGFDKFMIALNKKIPDILGALFNAFIPGTGGTVRQFVGEQAGTWNPAPGPVNLSPVYQTIETESSGGLTAFREKWPLYLGTALLLFGLYYTYEGDT